jgi:hypothetical protein
MKISNKRETIEKYDKIINEARTLMIAKNNDYGDSWRNMRITSITDQILVKVCRIRKLEETKEISRISEGIDAEYMDILNYCIFALIKIREKNDG